MKRIPRFLPLFVVLMVFFSGCAGQPPAPRVLAPPSGEQQAEAVEITLLHINDTHSKLEPVSTKLTLDISDTLTGKSVYAELGGFPRLWSAIESVRAAEPDVLFLHAGDAFQGTLFFTQFLGKADVDFLNAMELDAMVLGNHEFDKGPAVLRTGLLQTAHFDVVSANTGYSAEPELATQNILPYTIKEVNGENIGIIGLTLTETPYISSPGENITFADPVPTVSRAVEELEQLGINKIILLSHQSYTEDLKVAAAVEGVDVVVGGHSHTLLGDTTDLGLASAGDYPTVVENAAGETTLVVQSWEWAKALGMLTVQFDAEGKITGWNGSPKLLAGDRWFRIYDLPGPDGKAVRVEFTRDENDQWQVMESDGRAYTVIPPAERTRAHLDALEAVLAKLADDPRVMLLTDQPEGAEKLAYYAVGVNALKAEVACTAAEELIRGNNQGPGPIIADAMLWKTGADIAVMNPGGVRTNINPGPVSVAGVYELQPFGNTLVTLDLTGSDVLRVLEDMSDYTITHYTDRTPETALIYVSGVTFTLDVNEEKGARVKNAMVGQAGDYTALDPETTYTVVVNSFMASGGDMNSTLKERAGLQYDTGFIDSEATLEYIQGKTLTNSTEDRVKQIF